MMLSVDGSFHIANTSWTVIEMLTFILFPRSHAFTNSQNTTLFVSIQFRYLQNTKNTIKKIKGATH